MPVPSYLRLLELSAWENLLKSLGICSFGMPIPVSDTLTKTWFSWYVQETAISPRSVNFKALNTRFNITFSILSASKKNSGIPSSLVNRSANDFFSAIGLTEKTTPLT